MIFKNILSAISNLAFVPLCLHCDKKTEPGHFLLCHTCISSLKFLDPKEHCQYCFKISENPICSRCQTPSEKAFREQAIFHTTGCLLSLIRETSTHRFLIESMAAFCLYGFLSQGGHIPSILTSIPSCKLSEGVALQMAKWMQIRYVKLARIQQEMAGVVLFQMKQRRSSEVEELCKVYSIKSVLSMSQANEIY